MAKLALRPNAVAAKENQPLVNVQDEAWPGANAKRRPIGQQNSTASVQQYRLLKERLRCHHVQLNVVETSVGQKEQRERERKKAAKGPGSHALSGFGFLPKKRSWSDGDLNATATNQRQLVEEDSSSRSSLQWSSLQFGWFACRRWFCLFVFTPVWDFQPDDAQVQSPLIVTRQN